MASGGDLLLIRVPCEGAAQLLDLKNSRLVPGTQTLDRQWKEDDTLLIAGLPRFVQLPLVGNFQGMAGGLGCLRHQSSLKRVYHCNIQGRVFATGVPGDENVGRLAPFTW